MVALYGIRYTSGYEGDDGPPSKTKRAEFDTLATAQEYVNSCMSDPPEVPIAESEAIRQWEIGVIARYCRYRVSSLLFGYDGHLIEEDIEVPVNPSPLSPVDSAHAIQRFESVAIDLTEDKYGSLIIITESGDFIEWKGNTLNDRHKFVAELNSRYNLLPRKEINL